MAEPTVHETALPGLKLLHRGKVRDVYEVDAAHLLIVTTDRLSAFDVVLPDPIPGKGRVLHQISEFWFDRTAQLLPNHRSTMRVEDVVQDAGLRRMLAGRAGVFRRLAALPIEAVVRGHLIGSGWKDYQRTGGICGIALPAGLQEAQQLPEPIFTPSTKAPKGTHDENIPFAEAERLLGTGRAAEVRAAAIRLYQEAAAYASTRGIIIADTKFEFGTDPAGKLYLIDEALTPDSSRFWPRSGYRVGISPPSFDKQFVRDWLETQQWNKQPPAPRVPADVIARTAEKYGEALRLLTA